MSKKKREKYTSNPAKVGRLYDEIKKRFSKLDYFTPTHLTHDSVCGFKLVDTLRPFLEAMVEQGLLEKGDGKSRFKVSDKEFKMPDDTVSDENEDVLNETELPLMSELKDLLKYYKRFVIVTAVSGKKVNLNFLKSMKNYAKRKRALILILPSDIGNSNRNGKSIIELDRALKGCHVIYKDVFLNDNLCICSIKTSAKQINTLTGLDRIATKKGASIIIASTKPFAKSIPNRIGDIPLTIMTTGGAVTENNYDTDKYMSKRTAYIAEEDHTLGALIVEIQDNEIFHYRFTKATKKGTFTDLGIEYNPDGTATELSASKVVLGDCHTDQRNIALEPFLFDFVSRMHADTVILHDVFNATSITHHDKGKFLTKAIKANEGKNSLEKEGKGIINYLESWQSYVNNIVIVNSNHDRHLESYLEEGRFMADPINTRVGLRLASAYLDGENPLKHLIENLLGYERRGIKWLDLDEDYKVYGVQCGFHSDKGANGARGSINTYEKGIGNCVIGHSHSAQVLRDAYCVGTISDMNMGYNRGSLSSWTTTCCIIYSNGVKQLVNFIPVHNEYFYTI